LQTGPSLYRLSTVVLSLGPEDPRGLQQTVACVESTSGARWVR